jgi:hypothetical protein
MSKKGDRVGAILGSKPDGTVNFLGYGVYDGDEIPSSAAGQMGEILRDIGRANPKIVLDNGKVVWGCECWWGSEKRVAETLEGKKVVEIDIDIVRADWKRQVEGSVQ